MRLLFVHSLDNPEYWNDGLYAALNILSEKYEVVKCNLHFEQLPDGEFDFILGHGAFGSPADKALRNLKGPKGLCLAGNATPAEDTDYDIIFYETEWANENYLANVSNKKIHAFGINSSVYREILETNRVDGYLAPGAFADWKRLDKLAGKSGFRLAVGYIQEGNLEESMRIIQDLLLNGVIVSGMLKPDELVLAYNYFEKVYVPANLIGGGERVVLEARNCKCKVEVENDNPKLKELLYSDIYDEYYYANQLEKGIMSCLD